MERKIEFSRGETLESAVCILLAAKENGERVCGEFNGHMLHSDTVSMDSAYIEILGCTKEEYDKKIEERQKNSDKEEKLAEQRIIQNIPRWIEWGQSLIYPERYDEWKKCVNTRAMDLYHGSELDSALEIMQILETGSTIEEALKTFDDQDHHEISSALVRNIVFSFSSKGPEFWEATASEVISPEEKYLLEVKRQENMQLARLHAEKNTGKRL